ncbi:MAG: ABC transporter permease [Alphaproteobacteria bacterium]|nr:ABC transporter permease [Alphaproteobacteria bacterium]
MLLRLAWRNLWRHKRRSLITAFAMAIAVALCMATTAFTDGMGRKMFNVMVEQQLGHIQVHHPDYPTGRKLYDTVPEAAKTMDALEGLPEVAHASAQLMGFALIGGAEETTGGQLVGVEPAREIAVTRADERIVDGRFLEDGKPGEIVLGAGLADEIDVGVGDTVVVVTQGSDGSIGNALYEVVGLFRTGNAALDKSGSMMALADLQDLLVLPDQVHKITVLGHDPDDLLALKNAAIAVVPDGTQVQTWEEASPQAVQMMAMMKFSTLIMLFLVFAVSSFGILNTMAMSVFERTRELGVLKAIGLRPGKLVQLVVAESVFLAALAGSIGFGIGGLLDVYLMVYGLDISGGNPEGMSFQGITLDPVMYGAIEPFSIFSILAALILVSTGASFVPAWRASRLDPVEAIRTE